MATFKKASKSNLKLRMALIGPEGSGKTYTALAIAKELGKNVAVIDTEHGKAGLYTDDFEFGHVSLESYSPAHYMSAIDDAVKEGFDVLVIDSLSHAWAGKDGVLEYADERAKASRSTNSFAAWKEATPLQRRFIEHILAAPIHIIATMRSKTEWVIEKNEQGKNVPKKIGLQPVQRDDVGFEFDVVADMDSGRMIVGKTRCKELFEKTFFKAGKDVGDILNKWLGSNNGSVGELADPTGSNPVAEKHEGSTPSAPTTTTTDKPANDFKPEDWAKLAVARKETAKALARDIDDEVLTDFGMVRFGKASKKEWTREEYEKAKAWLRAMWSAKEWIDYHKEGV